MVFSCLFEREALKGCRRLIRVLAIRSFVLLALGLWGKISSSKSATPPTEGTQSVEVTSEGAGQEDASELFADAAEAILGQKGFTLLDDPLHSAYIVSISLSRSKLGTGSVKISAGDPDITTGARKVSSDRA